MAFEKLSDETIRKHKGLSFTGITTIFFCHDGKGNLFLAKRSKKARDEHGRWDLGAGGLKHGQTAEESLKREVLEEYGVIPKRIEFMGYFDAFRKSEEKYSTHWLALCFAVLVDRDKVKIMEPEMVDDSGWFTLDQLPSPLHSQFGIFWEKHGKKLQKIMSET